MDSSSQNEGQNATPEYTSSSQVYSQTKDYFLPILQVMTLNKTVNKYFIVIM